MLNKNERRYFDNLKQRILRLFGLQVNIYPLDHATFLQKAGEPEILGCCHRLKDNLDQTIGYVITIDESYIRACYYGRQTRYSRFTDNQLIETICHEIAHMYVWEHSKDHTELTNELYDAVMRVNS